MEDAPVIVHCIDVGKRALVVDWKIAGDGCVLPYDWLGARAGVGGAQLVEKRTIDQKRMAVPFSRSRANDRRARPPVMFDHGANGRLRYERNIDQRHQRRDHTRPIHNAQSGKQ